MSDDDRFLAVELRLKICEARLRRGAEATISALNGGAEGKQGERGPRGLTGDIGPMPRHQWDGTKLRFQQGPAGDDWGAYVDLKGATGAQGYTGVVVQQSTTAGSSYWPSSR